MYVVPRVTGQNAQDDALLLASGHGSCVSLSDQSFLALQAFTDMVCCSRRKRDKLARYNTIEDAVRLISQSERILVLTGAGISGFLLF
jgi:D-arabinose 5-phosphate isomerase GutQ